MACETLSLEFVGVDKLSGAVGGIANSFKSLTTTALKTVVGGLAAVTGGMIAGGAAALNMGAGAEEMLSKLNSVFGDLTGGVSASLEDFADLVGRNKFELQGMAATIGDTLSPLGFTGQALEDTSVQLVKLATDLSSFNDMPMDEALARLRGTLVGSHENALAFGVVINENVLKAELAANGWDKLTGAALEQAKVQARINLLMAGTTAAQGDAEKTAGSFTNRIRAMQGAFAELVTEIGLKMIPVLTPLMDKLAELVEKAMPAIRQFVDEKLVPAFGNFVQGVLDVIGVIEGLYEIFFQHKIPSSWYSLFGLQEDSNIVGFLFDLKRAVQEVWSWLSKEFDFGVWEYLEELFYKVADALHYNEDVFDAMESGFTRFYEIMNNLAGVVNRVQEYFSDAGAKAGMSEFSLLIDNIKESVIGFLTNWRMIAPIVGIVGVAIAAITSPLTLLTAALVTAALAWQNNWGGIRDIVMNVWSQIQPVFEKFKTSIIETVTQALASLSAWWTENGPFIQELATQIFTALKEEFEELASKILPFLVEQFNKFKDWFNEHGPLIKDFLQKLADILTTVVIPAFSEFWLIVEPILNFLIDLILNELVIVMAIFTGDWGLAWETAGNMLSDFRDTVFAVIEAAFGFIISRGLALADVMKDSFEGWIEDVRTRIINFLNDSFLPDAFVGLGRSFMSSMSSGILSGIGSVIESASSAANSVLNAFNSAWDAHSPPREPYRLASGFMAQLAKGLDTGPNLELSANRAANSVLSGAESGLQNGGDLSSLTQKSLTLNMYNQIANDMDMAVVQAGAKNLMLSGIA